MDSIMLVYFGSYVLRINVEMKCINEVSQAVIERTNPYLSFIIKHPLVTVRTLTSWSPKQHTLDHSYLDLVIYHHTSQA